MKYKNYIIVGCGGVAAYFIPPFVKMFWRGKNKSSICFIDKDSYELKNLDRQMESASDVGLPKSMKMASYARRSIGDMLSMGKHKCEVEINERTMFFAPGDEVPERSFVFCFVDNHEARLAVYNAVKNSPGSAVVFGANGEYSAHAYYYAYGLEAYENGDPLERYPEIGTDKSDSPFQVAGCDSEVVISSSPQTPLANMTAASMSLSLWHLWDEEKEQYEDLSEEDKESIKERAPVELAMGPRHQNMIRLGRKK